VAPGVLRNPLQLAINRNPRGRHVLPCCCLPIFRPYHDHCNHQWLATTAFPDLPMAHFPTPYPRACYLLPLTSSTPTPHNGASLKPPGASRRAVQSAVTRRHLVQSATQVGTHHEVLTSSPPIPAGPVITSVVESMEIEDCSFNPQLAPGSKKLPNVKSKVKEYWEKGSGSQGGAAAHAGGYPSSLSSGMGTAGMGSSSSSAFRDFTESGGCGSLKQYASTLAEQALYTAAANVFSGWQRRGDGDGSCAGLTIAANTQGANQGERNFGAVVPDHSSKGDEKGGRKKILLRRKGSRGKVPEAIPFVDEDVSGDPDLEYVLEQHLSGGAGVMVR